MVYTPEQQRVIDLHGKNILVSAAAGSGKTAVLTERIVKMISDGKKPVDIDRLLVVTFTNAAAAEMRERIGAAIAARLEREPDNEHLQKQATLIHNAQITTIDSFCMFVIRNNFNDIGLDPGFRVADEGELRLLKQDVMQELLEEEFARKEEGFLHCVEYFSTGNQDKAIEGHILKLYQFAESNPWPEEWLEERKLDYGAASLEELEKAGFMEFGMEQVRLAAEDCLRKMRECIAICEQPDGPYMYGEVLEREAEQLEKLTTVSHYRDGHALFGGVAFGRLPSKKDDSVAAVKREIVQGIRKEIKETLKKICAGYFPAPPETVLAYMNGSKGAVCRLIDLTVAFKEALDRRKREENIIDFSDMEHLALSVLVHRTEPEDGSGRKGYEPTGTALDYRDFFEEILIDEYQDSNPVQEMLLESISGESAGRFNRFMVGDVKQSIYKFRLARPEIFMEKYEDYGRHGTGQPADRTVGNTALKEGAGEEKERIDLHKNFRSRKEVLDSVNFLFARIMGKQLGGVEYDEDAALYYGASYPAWEEEEAAGYGTALAGDAGVRQSGSPNSTELLLIRKEEGGDGQEEEGRASLTSRQREALAVAKRIKELTAHFKVTDKESGRLRPVSYKDIVILLRTTAGWDEDFKSVLKEEGIPAHVSSKTGYFAAKEIQTLLQLLRILDNPRQDIPLFGVMKSCFGGFSDEEIGRIKAGTGRKKCLYFALKEFAGKRPGEGEILVEKEEEAPATATEEAFAERKEEVFTGRAEEAYAEREEETFTGRAEEAYAEREEETFTGRTEEVFAERKEETFTGRKEEDFTGTEEKALAGKVRRFLDFLDAYREKTVYMPIHELLQDIIAGTDYLPYVAALPGGGQRKANVQILLEKASAFEQTSYYGLFHFVRYIEQLEKYDVDYGEANVLDEKADVVRIMSIHKSKGLEFPVCFVCGLAKKFNMQDLTGKMVADVDMGIGVDFVDVERRLQSKTIRKNIVAEKMRLDNLGEELRVLYVALTRAKEKLIMTGTLERPEKKMAALLPAAMRDGLRLPYGELAGAGCYLDFLLPALCRHSGFRPLWEEYGLDVPAAGQEARWDVPFLFRMIGEEDLLAAEIAEQAAAEGERFRLESSDPAEDTDKELMTYMSELFAYRYEHAGLSDLYTKTTVSELKKGGQEEEQDFSFRLYEEETVIPYIPKFMQQEESIGGAGRGSAFHKVMELLDFSRAGGKGEVAAQMERMVREGMLSEEYARAVSVSAVEAFLRTSLAGRMKAAAEKGCLYREQPFVLGLPAKELNEKFPEEELVLIQGIIDVYFVEDGEIVVADYKTDRADSGQELVSKYRKQLDYYAHALQELTGRRVKEKMIYSFALKEEISVEKLESP